MCYDSDKKYFDSEEFFKKFFAIGGAIVLAFILIFVGTAAVKASLASGEISYCFTTVEWSNGVKSVKVMGFREWCGDRTLGAFGSEDEALALTKKMNCRLGIK